MSTIELPTLDMSGSDEVIKPKHPGEVRFEELLKTTAGRSRIAQHSADFLKALIIYGDVKDGDTLQKVIRLLEEVHRSVDAPTGTLPDGWVPIPGATKGVDFGCALFWLKREKRVTRAGWNGKGMWLLFVPEDYWNTSVGPSNVPKAHRLPWIGLKTADGGFVPWQASQTDMLAMDWEMVT